MKTRTRYRWPSRLEAEQAEQKASQEAIDNYRACLALHSGTMRRVIRCGPYDASIFDEQSPSGPRVLVVWHPGTEQADSLTIRDAYEWSREVLESYAISPPIHDEERALRTVAEAIRREVV